MASPLSQLAFARADVDTRPMTNFFTGGTAAWVVDVRTPEELRAALPAIKASGLPWLCAGAGTNMVFPPRYEGVLLRVLADGAVIHGTNARVEANVRWMPLLRAAAKQGLGGMESFAGLPGTVGGAVRGNAGCFGMETRDVLVEATVVDLDGNVEVHPAEWFEFSYRTSRLKREGGGIVWDATLRFVPQEESVTMEKIRATAALRSSKQPAGKSTGSFFMNPPEHSAGALIDQAGLKGLRVGDAYVPEKHGNFLMNAGAATPEDLAELVRQLQERVHAAHGVHLEPEVVLVDRAWWIAQGVTFLEG